jgi:hypothetical protein
VLALGVLDAFVKTHPKISAQEIHWRAAEVLRGTAKPAQ